MDVRARLSVGGARPRRGRLVLSPAPITWVAARGGREVCFGGPRDAQEVARALARGHDDAVVVEVPRPDGALRLRLAAGDAATLLDLLTDPPRADPAAVRPLPAGSRWWAVACLVAAALWAGFVALASVGTYEATATVLADRGWGTCEIRWVDPSGGVHRGDSDCLGEDPGTLIEVLVPRDGYDAVTSIGTLWVAGTVVPVPLAAIGTTRLAVVRRRRRTPPETVQPGGSTHAPGRTPAGQPALDDGRTATALRRAMRRGWAVVGLGLACVVAVVLLSSTMADADESLRAEGARTEGTVVSVTADTRWSEGSARVAFRVGGRERVERVHLAASADGYATGDRVTVFYDPEERDRITIDGIPYEPAWTHWPFILTIVGSVTAGPGGAWMLRQARRCRRLLSEQPWQPVRVRVPAGGRHHGLRFVVGSHEVWRSRSAPRWPQVNREPRLLAGWGLPDEDPTTVPADQDVWWVTDGRSAVFSPDRGGPLVHARRPRR